MNRIDTNLTNEKNPEHMKLPEWFFKIIIGILIYMILIDSLILLKFGFVGLTPEQWFVIPFTALFEIPSSIALLFLCIIIGWIIIEQRK